MNKKLLLLIICMSTLFGDLIHPPDGSELSYVHVLFKWEEIPGSTGYDFQLSGSNDFTTPLNISTTKPFHIEKDYINWQSSYYWRVRANDGDWMLGEFSTGSPSYVFASSDVAPVEI